MSLRGVWRLAACAILLPGSIALAKTPPTAPVAAVSDAQLYQDAMRCKVRVEALAAISSPQRERERVTRALEYWTLESRSAGARLGKAEGEIMGDEILFGLTGEEGADGYRRARHCVEAAARR